MHELQFTKNFWKTSFRDVSELAKQSWNRTKLLKICEKNLVLETSTKKNGYCFSYALLLNTKNVVFLNMSTGKFVLSKAHAQYYSKF